MVSAVGPIPHFCPDNPLCLQVFVQQKSCSCSIQRRWLVCDSIDVDIVIRLQKVQPLRHRIHRWKRSRIHLSPCSKRFLCSRWRTPVAAAAAAAAAAVATLIPLFAISAIHQSIACNRARQQGRGNRGSGCDTNADRWRGQFD